MLEREEQRRDQHQKHAKEKERQERSQKKAEEKRESGQPQAGMDTNPEVAQDRGYIERMNEKTSKH